MKNKTVHSIICNTNSKDVFSIISNSKNWPNVLEPCKKVTIIDRDKNYEHIQVTALVNGIDMTWESKRIINPNLFKIEAKIVKPMELVKDMVTIWQVITLNSQQCLLVLEHEYNLKDNIAGEVENVSTIDEAEEFINSGIDLNSIKELNNIKSIAEENNICNDNVLKNEECYSNIYESSAKSIYDIMKNTLNLTDLFSQCSNIKEDNKNICTSEIECDDSILRIDFKISNLTKLLASMKGQLKVVPIDSNRCVLLVSYSLKLIDDVISEIGEVNKDECIFRLNYDFIMESIQKMFKSIEVCSQNTKLISNDISSSIFLPFEPDKVFSFLSDITLWQKYIPHCTYIEVLYNDGKFQEFLLGTDENESFRSIRFCDSDNFEIKYFQPNPPTFLLKHSGAWSVKSYNGGTIVKSTHSIEINYSECSKKLGIDDKTKQLKVIEEMIKANSIKTVRSCESYLNEG